MLKRLRTTVLLLLFAVALFSFAVLKEPHTKSSTYTKGLEPLLESILPSINGSGFSELKSNSLLEYTLKDNAHTKAQSYLPNSIPTAYTIEAPEVIQTPELPTGCESVSLGMLLMYMGFELDKTTIADDYLLYDTDNMAMGYVGDPYSTAGAGCFPPVIVDTADLFLAEMDSEQRAVDVSGSTLDSLFHYIASGLPVVIWSTMYMVDVDATDSIFERDGKEYTWYSSEHCILLCGYDQERGVVLVNDPLEGMVERDLSTFEQIYNDIGQYAVIIP